MFFLFLFLLISNLRCENKSVLWVTNSAKDVESLLSFKKEKGLDFSFTLVSDVYKDTDTKIEKADVFFNFYPVAMAFFPSGTKIKTIENYPDSLDSFFSFLNYYCDISSCSSKGFFSSYPISDDRIADLLKSRGYRWMYGGISENDSYLKDYNGFKSVFFEVLKSSEQIRISSSSFFIVDDVYNSSSSLNLLKEIFSNKDLSFLTVSEGIKVYSSTDVSGEKQGIDTSSFFKCDKSLNYISYLTLIISDIGNLSAANTELNKSYFDLFGYFDSVCSEEMDSIEDIRRITKQAYQNAGKSIPYFVYYDFLTNTFYKKYDKKVSENSIAFDSLSENKIKKVEIVKNDSDYLFNIVFSTIVLEGEVHIYADINKRRNAGSDAVIGKTEKIDPLYAWEYAIVANIPSKSGSLYKAGYRDFSKVYSFKIEFANDSISFRLSPKEFSGNFTRWNYIISFYDKNIIGGIYDLSDNKFLTVSE